LGGRHRYACDQPFPRVCADPCPGGGPRRSSLPYLAPRGFFPPDRIRRPAEPRSVLGGGRADPKCRPRGFLVRFWAPLGDLRALPVAAMDGIRALPAAAVDDNGAVRLSSLDEGEAVQWLTLRPQITGGLSPMSVPQTIRGVVSSTPISTASIRRLRASRPLRMQPIRRVIPAVIRR